MTKKFIPYETLKSELKRLHIDARWKYRRFYKMIRHAPYTPDVIYKDKGWEGWNALFEKQPLRRQFITYTELKKEVKKLGIKKSFEYFERYKEIEGAPSCPHRKVYKEWVSWKHFLT